MNILNKSFFTKLFQKKPINEPLNDKVQKLEAEVVELKNAPKEKKEAQKKTPEVDMRALSKVALELGELDTAIYYAKDPLYYHRYNLHALYKEIERDGHVVGVMGIHAKKVLREQFLIVDENGNEDKEMTKFFKQKWFKNFRTLCIYTPLYGHTLIEPVLGNDFEGNRTVKELYVMPREHVSPEFGIILPEAMTPPTTQTGIPFREGFLANYVIEIGEREDLGLLHILGYEVIRKRYVDGDWGLNSELHGLPLTVMKTKETRQSELNKKATSLDNMGSNGWMLTDSDDEVSYLEADKEYEIYQMRMDRADATINLILIGSTSLGQEQAFVGSAEVSERIADDFKFSQLQSIEYDTNDVLIPYLIRMGFPLQGRKLVYPALTADLNTSKNAPGVPEKKKAKLNYDCACGGTHAQFEIVQLSLWESVVEKIAKLIHSNALVKDFLKSKEVTKLVDDIYTYMWGEYKDNYVKEADWTVKDKELLRKVHDNIYTFSGAKTMAQLDELKNLVYENGKLLPWTEYRAKVLEIDSTYNVTYLEAERNHVQISSQMGSNWVRIEDAKKQYPYLKYVTEGDARVRPEHQRLQGIVLPVDDKFWLTFYPPNGWRCRCDVLQMTEDEAKGIVSDSQKSMDRGFENVKDTYFHQNTGATGLVFPPEHAYFNSLNEADRELLMKNAELKRKKLGL